MKLLKFKTIKEYTDIDDKDIVNKFIEDYFYNDDEWEDDDEMLLSDDWDDFWDDYGEVTDEDKKRISKLINKEIQKQLSQQKEEQLKIFKNRASIIQFFDDLFYDTMPSELSRLSIEEVIDLIIKNGKK